jgi:hypothetical protein
MGDNRRFPGAGLPRDAAVDSDGKEIGVPWPYGNQFEHDENEGYDEPIGRNPNDNGSKVYPEWWTQDEAE